MAGPASKTTRGILNPEAIGQKFLLSRLPPSADLVPLIDHYWIVHWDLRGQPPYRVQTLPFPAVHIAIEQRRPEVYGVVSKKFSRRLQSNGRVFGVKFRPAMFFPFLGSPVSRLTDRVVSLRSVFGSDGSTLRAAILDETDETRCLNIFETFLRERLPGQDPIRDQLRDLVEQVAIDRSVLRAEQLTRRMGVGLRTLQLAFSKYVGVTPKWVIQRYRLQEAAEQLAGNTASLVELSSGLGYFDQSHFIRDFRRIVGSTPAQYAAKAERR